MKYPIGTKLKYQDANPLYNKHLYATVIEYYPLDNKYMLQWCANKKNKPHGTSLWSEQGIDKCMSVIPPDINHSLPNELFTL